MRILVVGDVVGEPGCRFISRHLSQIKRHYGIDFCVVNGENAARGNGVTADSCETLLAAGADVLTTGNHVYQKREVYDYLDDSREVVRPYNYHGSCPGQGYVVTSAKGVDILVANLQGRAFMEPVDNPFLAADKLLKEAGHRAKIRIFDFHAEATSEKLAMAHYLDGRATLLVGTHTHVQTADETVFPGGLGYITDLGMTGPTWSILGLDPKNVVQKFITGMPQRFETGREPVELCGIVAEVEESTGKTTKIERIKMQ
jgi:metallophosphoesterase (TIGR00282 family)